MFKTKNQLRKPKPVMRNCEYCHLKTEPDYKQVGNLTKYITERGKIMGVTRNGVCYKHQRLLAIAIKRARHVALLPFVARA